MKPAILILQGLATLCTLLGGLFIASSSSVKIPLLPAPIADVPLLYAFAIPAALLSIASLFFISRGWERETLPRGFIAATKMWATSTLLLTMLPAMIFVSVLWQEIRR